MLKQLLTACGALIALGAAAADIDFGYVHESGEFSQFGTGKKETYHLAIGIDDPFLTGKTVKAINVRIPEDATLSACSAFLTSQLKVSSKKPVIDIASAEFTAAPGVVRVPLAEPVTITGAFYAGFSFTIGSLDTEADKKPVLVAPGSNDQGFYLLTSKSYIKWNNKGADGLLPISVEVEGDFQPVSVGVQSLDPIVTIPDTENVATAVIVNHGTEDVRSIDYTYSVNGQSSDVHQEFPQPISGQFYGTTGSIQVVVPAIAALGAYEGTLTITKVNGQANTDATASITNSVSVMEKVPVHRVVMEEFTGTWCGYCPRGWVAMKLMNEELPDNFIALSYHNGDPMQITTDYPVSVSGYPSASLDRTWDVDPYEGTGPAYKFGLRDDVLTRMALPFPANVEVTALLSADGTTISSETEVYFFNDLAENPYRIFYAVTADNLQGTDASWAQHNYYTGNTAYGANMQLFSEGGSTLFIPFDDVVIYRTDYSGEPGSLPAAVAVGQTATHSKTFALADMLNYKGESLVQDPGLLNVVALLVDTTTGHIVNGCKARVTSDASIQQIGAEPSGEAAVYDLMGRRVLHPTHGLYLINGRKVLK